MSPKIVIYFKIRLDQLSHYRTLIAVACETAVNVNVIYCWTYWL